MDNNNVRSKVIFHFYTTEEEEKEKENKKIVKNDEIVPIQKYEIK